MTTAENSRFSFLRIIHSGLSCLHYDISAPFSPLRFVVVQVNDVVAH